MTYMYNCTGHFAVNTIQRGNHCMHDYKTQSGTNLLEVEEWEGVLGTYIAADCQAHQLCSPCSSFLILNCHSFLFAY